MVDIEIVHEWLAKADEDFQFALVNLQDRNSFFPQICFHFQQAAEKYLKAYIVAHELEFQKTHELPLLLRTCCSRDPSFGELIEDCEYLTTYYVETRYPVHWPTRFSHKQAHEASECASRIQSFVKERLDLPAEI